MSASGLKLTDLSEADFLRNRIADLEVYADQFDRAQDGPFDDETKKRVALIAADFHERAEQVRKRLNALETKP